MFKNIPTWLVGFTLMMALFLFAVIAHVTHAEELPYVIKANRGLQLSKGVLETPKPFYLPIDQIIPKKKRLAVKMIKEMGDAGPDRIVDFSNFDGPIITQYRGDCTAQGLSNTADNILRRNSYDLPDLVSQESLWDRYRVYSAEAAVKAWSSAYAKRESAWPFGKASWVLPEEKSRYRLAEIVDLDTDYYAALKAIDDGFPVYVAASVSQGMASCYKEIGPNSKPTSGGHAFQLAGARVKDGKISFLVHQTWGLGCGDYGYQWMPASTCDVSGAYCAFWKVTAIEDRAKGKTLSILPPSVPSPKPVPESLETTIDGVKYQCTKK
jgi:hypothetical protein